MKEIIFKMATLNRETREFIAERIAIIKKDRIMTIRLDYHVEIPARKYKAMRSYTWIPACIN
jgi:hypothetical protein